MVVLFINRGPNVLWLFTDIESDDFPKRGIMIKNIMIQVQLERVT